MAEAACGQSALSQAAGLRELLESMTGWHKKLSNKLGTLASMADREIGILQQVDSLVLAQSGSQCLAALQRVL